MSASIHTKNGFCINIACRELVCVSVPFDCPTCGDALKKALNDKKDSPKVMANKQVFCYTC